MTLPQGSLYKRELETLLYITASVMQCYDVQHCLRLTEGRLEVAPCRKQAAEQALSLSRKAHALCQGKQASLKVCLGLG